MEIRNLITFLHVAELNSFTKAAKVLGYSQSTISFQIKQLENELNCLLFERINHTITLTEKGKNLLDYAQQINHLTNEFNDSINNESALSGHIHVVTSDSICEAMISEHYVDFLSKYPNITLKISNGDTNEMFQLLDSNKADLMITLDSHVYDNNYVIAKEESVPAHFVTSASSPFVSKKNLSINDIINEPFILTEKDIGYRSFFDKNIAKKSLALTPVLEIGRTDLITKVLAEGVGISFLPDFVTQKGVQDGKLAYLDVIDFPHDVWKQLIHHRNKWLSRPLRAFIDYVVEHEFKNS